MLNSVILPCFTIFTSACSCYTHLSTRPFSFVGLTDLRSEITTIRLAHCFSARCTFVAYSDLSRLIWFEISHLIAVTLVSAELVTVIKPYYILIFVKSYWSSFLPHCMDLKGTSRDWCSLERGQPVSRCDVLHTGYSIVSHYRHVVMTEITVQWMDEYRTI